MRTRCIFSVMSIACAFAKTTSRSDSRSTSRASSSSCAAAAAEHTRLRTRRARTGTASSGRGGGSGSSGGGGEQRALAGLGEHLLLRRRVGVWLGGVCHLVRTTAGPCSMEVRDEKGRVPTNHCSDFFFKKSDKGKTRQKSCLTETRSMARREASARWCSRAGGGCGRLWLLGLVGRGAGRL
jgi:hypothetical protein